MEKNLETNVSIRSNDSKIPLDTNISVSKVETDELKKLLGTDVYDSYDISLFSNSANKKVSKLDNGKFLVSIPVSEKLAGKTLVAVYITENGEKEKYVVTPDNGMATFETAHFSTYSLIEKQSNDNEEKEENQNTFDGIIFYIGLGILSIIGLSGTGLCIKKRNNNN